MGGIGVSRWRACQDLQLRRRLGVWAGFQWRATPGISMSAPAIWVDKLCVAPNLLLKRHALAPLRPAPTCARSLPYLEKRLGELDPAAASVLKVAHASTPVVVARRERRMIDAHVMSDTHEHEHTPAQLAQGKKHRRASLTVSCACCSTPRCMLPGRCQSRVHCHQGAAGKEQERTGTVPIEEGQHTTS